MTEYYLMCVVVILILFITYKWSNNMDSYGATHFSVMKDGKTPQMMYKQIKVKYNDGTSELVWYYLSECGGGWFRSGLSELQITNLKEII